MRRTRTGKNIELSARDIEIFRLLERYRYLRSTFIHAFVGGASETRFKERLGDLFHEGYLDRPEQQWMLANCRYVPVVYEIGEGGRRALRQEGIGNGESWTWLTDGAHRQFSHSLMICEVLASIDLEVRADPNIRFIGWPQILTRAPEQTRASSTAFRVPVPAGGYLVPDGIFGIEYRAGEKKSYRFFALEADRGTMPVTRSNPNQTSYLRKIAAYGEIIAHRVYKTHLGLPNLLVLTVTVGESRVQEIMSRMKVQSGGNAGFLFKACSAKHLTTPRHQLLLEPWQRAGFPPMAISSSD